MGEGLSVVTKWFGKSWGAPVCEDSPHVETPEGALCPYCTKTIGPDDSGLIIPYIRDFSEPATDEPWHIDCWRKSLGISRR